MINIFKSFYIIPLAFLSSIAFADVSKTFLLDNISKRENFNYEKFKIEYENKLLILKNTGADPAYIAKEKNRLTLIEKSLQKKQLNEVIGINNCYKGSFIEFNKEINNICRDHKSNRSSIIMLPKYNYKLDGNNLIILSN